MSSLLEHAKKDLNLREVPRGSNRHPRIQAMLRNCGLRGAYAWCAAAVVTWIHEVYGEHNPVKMTADCDVLLAQARKTGTLYNTPQPLDIGLRVSPSNPNDANHALLVQRLLEENRFLSIEGNTNNDGSREGYGVFELSRRSSGFKYFRWIELLKVDSSGIVVPKLEFPETNIVLPNGDSFAKGINKEGSIFVPVREFYAALVKMALESTYEDIGFNNTSKKAMLGTDTLESSVILDGKTWCSVKELVSHLDYNVGFNNETKTLYITE